MAQRPPRSRTAVPIASYALLPPPVKGWNPDISPMLMGPQYAPQLDNWIPRDNKLVMRSPFVALHSRTNFPSLTTQSISAAGHTFIPGTWPAQYLLTRRGVPAGNTALIDPVHAPYSRWNGVTSDLTVGGACSVVTWQLAGALPAYGLTYMPGASNVTINEANYFVSLPTAAQLTPVTAPGPFQVQNSIIVAMTNNLPTSLIQAGLTNAPQAVTCLAGHQSRLWAGGGTPLSGATGYDPNQLFFSNPITPGAPLTNVASLWQDPTTSTDNKILIDAANDDPITAMASVSAGLLILRRRSIYILRGNTPATYAVQLVTKEFGCLDPRSVVFSGNGGSIMFMSHRGLCASSGVSVQNISGAVYHDLSAALARWETAILATPGQITAARTTNELVVFSVSGNSIPGSGINGPSTVLWSGVYDTRAGAWHRWSSYLFDTDVNTIGNAPVARPALPAYLIQNPYYGGIVAWGSHRGTYMEPGKANAAAFPLASKGDFEDMDNTNTCGGGVNALLPIPAVWRSSYFATSGNSRFYAAVLRGWVDYRQFGLNAPYTSARRLSATWYNEAFQPYTAAVPVPTALPSGNVPAALIATTYSERTEVLPEVQHLSTDFSLGQESTHVSVLMAWCANLVFATTSSTPAADGVYGSNEIYAVGVEYEQTRVLR